MMYADKGLALFSLMNDMSDTLILESNIRGVTAVKPKRERASRFSAFMNHPAMVAVLCAVVSLGVVAAIVMAGRGGPVTPPVGTPPVEETVTQEPSDSELIPADFASYESIIRMYRKMVEVNPMSLTPEGENNPEIDQLFSFPHEQARKWYEDLENSIFFFYYRKPGPYSETEDYTSFGYVRKDLNGDGTEELVLLTDDGNLVALFTLCRGKPVLLRSSYYPRYRGYLNQDGLVMEKGSSGADVIDFSFYRIDASTGQLVFIEAIGLEGHTEDLQIIYYHQIGEQKTYISEAAYHTLVTEGLYASFGREENQNVLGDAFVPLFDTLSFSSYGDVLAVFRRLLMCEDSIRPGMKYTEMETLYYGELLPQIKNENDKAILDELFHDAANYRFTAVPAYALKDLDGDGQDELILLTADKWVFGLFTMENGVPKNLSYTAGWGMDMGIIAADGTVCQLYLNKGQNETVKIQRLTDGELVTVEEFGIMDEKVWVDFGAESTGDEEPYFYRMVNGERQRITVDDYNELKQKYDIDTMTGFSTDLTYAEMDPLYYEDLLRPLTGGKG